MSRGRPTPTLAIALLALFLALDGPATAARLIDGRSIRRDSITSAQVHNRTLGTQDLSRKALKALTDTPAGSVGAAQLGPGSVTASKLAAGSVGTAALASRAVAQGQLADGAVGTDQLAVGSISASRVAAGAIGGAAIADGSLQTSDIGDIYGTVTVDFKPFRINDCQTARVTQLPSLGTQPAQIADDLVVVSPGAAGFTDLITLAGYPGADNTLRIVACRVGRDPADPDNPNNMIDPPPTTFQYLGIDAP